MHGFVFFVVSWLGEEDIETDDAWLLRTHTLDYVGDCRTWDRIFRDPAEGLFVEVDEHDIRGRRSWIRVDSHKIERPGAQVFECRGV